MHSIFKSLLTIILPLTFTHHVIYCMQEAQTLTVFDIEPNLRERVVCHLFPYSFNETDNPKKIHDHIANMKGVSKKIKKYVESRPVTQAIINHLSHQKHQDYLSEKIATAEMTNYFQKSNILHHKINYIGPRKIKALLEQGADINYFPRWKSPLLFKTLHNYNKTKLLLDHGANPNAIYCGKTALQLMIEKNCFSMTKLLLTYNPDNKCLPVAAFYQNFRIINLVLQKKDIPASELNEALGVALQKKNNEETVKALVKAGARFDDYYTHLKNRFIIITTGNEA